MSREVTQAPPFAKGRGQGGENVDITTKKQKAVNNLTALFFVCLGLATVRQMSLRLTPFPSARRGGTYKRGIRPPSGSEVKREYH